MPTESGVLRRFVAASARALRWRPKSYPQVWCWAVGGGLAVTLTLVALEKLTIRAGYAHHGVGFFAAISAGVASTLTTGAAESYRLSRQRDDSVVADWGASRSTSQDPQR